MVGKSVISLVLIYSLMNIGLCHRWIDLSDDGVCDQSCMAQYKECLGNLDTGFDLVHQVRVCRRKLRKCKQGVLPDVPIIDQCPMDGRRRRCKRKCRRMKRRCKRACQGCSICIHRCRKRYRRCKRHCRWSGHLSRSCGDSHGVDGDDSPSLNNLVSFSKLPGRSTIKKIRCAWRCVKKYLKCRRRCRWRRCKRRCLFKLALCGGKCYCK